MPDDPSDRFQPAPPSTQREIGGVLERAFAREGGREPNEEEIRRLQFDADEALREAEVKLSLAREAEAAMAQNVDPADVERWRLVAQDYHRMARELRERAEDLRQRIV